jgi:hypothetical protein
MQRVRESRLLNNRSGERVERVDCIGDRSRTEEGRMERKLITCPGYAHLEEIEMERTPCGILIGSCTRFSPPSAVTCARECAVLMDRRDRLRAPDHRERVLLLYADDHAHRLAEQLAAVLGADDLVVELADAEMPSAPAPQDYGAVVVIAPVRRRRLARASAEYVSSHRDALTGIPWYFVPISTRSAEDLPAGEAAASVSSSTGSTPRYAAAISMHTRSSTTLDQHIRALAEKIADEIPNVDSSTTDPSGTTSIGR